MKAQRQAVKYDLKTIMKHAWAYVRKHGVTIAEALKKSWNYQKVYSVKYLLAKGYRVTFTYIKKSTGELRTALGSNRKDQLIRHNAVPQGVICPPDGTKPYFDLEKKAWRSFKLENVRTIIAAEF